MNEQPATDSKETTTTVEKKVEPTQPVTEVAETTVKPETTENIWDDYKQEMKKYTGATQEDTKKDVIPATKTGETPKVETVGEIPKKEEVVTDQPKVEGETELPEIKIEDLTFMRKGEKIPLMRVLQEFEKEGILQDFVSDYTSKNYDYYGKTQEHSKTVKDFQLKVEAHKQRIEILEVRNLANELGEASIKPKEWFESAEDKDGNVKYDDPDKAYKNYIDDVSKRGQELVNIIQETRLTNANTLKSFANKNGLDFDYCENELLPQLFEHISPSLAGEKIPFKEETFDIFYKGLKYDEDLKTEKELSFKEGQKTAYTEVSETQDKGEPAIVSTQGVETQSQEGWEDYENSIQMELNKGKQ